MIWPAGVPVEVRRTHEERLTRLGAWDWVEAQLDHIDLNWHVCPKWSDACVTLDDTKVHLRNITKSWWWTYAILHEAAHVEQWFSGQYDFYDTSFCARFRRELDADIRAWGFLFGK